MAHVGMVIWKGGVSFNLGEIKEDFMQFTPTNGTDHTLVMAERGQLKNDRHET